MQQERGSQVTINMTFPAAELKKNVDGTITKYACDGDQVIAECDDSDNLLRKFMYGHGIDEPTKMQIIVSSIILLGYSMRLR